MADETCVPRSGVRLIDGLVLLTLTGALWSVHVWEQRRHLAQTGVCRQTPVSPGNAAKPHPDVGNLDRPRPPSAKPPQPSPGEASPQNSPSQSAKDQTPARPDEPPVPVEPAAESETTDDEVMLATSEEPDWTPSVRPKPLTENVERGLAWLAQHQLPGGAWGQGEESQAWGRVLVTDVPSVADTSLAALALLHAGSTPSQGPYAGNLLRAAEYVCSEVESADEDSLYVTAARGTRVQGKLGPFVDTFLANLLLAEVIGRMPDAKSEQRVGSALEKILAKIQKNQRPDGTWNAEGWAPALAQSLAVKGLNRAAQRGLAVDDRALANSAEYSRRQFDQRSGRFSGAGSAGVELYSSASHLGVMNDWFWTARQREGSLRRHAAGAAAGAKGADTVAPSARLAEAQKDLDAAQQSVVARLNDPSFIAGFGSNGGEEFLSYMNIGETLASKGGAEWERWDQSITENLNRVQNVDGSWTGHHCITGRTICTGAALLTLLSDRTPLLNHGGGIASDRWRKARQLQAECEALSPAKLVESFQAADAQERLIAVKVASQRGLEVPDAYIALLRDKNEAVREEARQALVKLAKGADFGPAERTASAVTRAAQRWQRYFVCRRLVSECEADAPQVLTAKFRDPDALKRWAAVSVARSRKLAVPDPLVAMLKDDDPDVREEAHGALVELADGSDFGPTANGTIDVDQAIQRWQRYFARRRFIQEYRADEPQTLLARFQDPDALKRGAAVAVARIRKLTLPDQLIALLSDADAEVREEAHVSLVQLAGDYDFGPPRDADQDAVKQAITVWTKWTRRQSRLSEFAGLPPEALTEAFRSAEAADRWAAVTAANSLRLPLCDAFISLIRDPDNEVRQESRRALKRLACGEDHGPPEVATEAQREAAFQAWNDWRKAEGERIEQLAQRLLRMAEIVSERNPTAAVRRLKEIVQKHPDTQAGRRAQELLAKLDSTDSAGLAAQPKDMPLGKSPRPEAGASERPLPSAAETNAKRGPAEKLEKEAANLLRVYHRGLQHRTKEFRAKLQELVERYPQTQAAREAQRILETPEDAPNNPAKKTRPQARTGPPG